jgi:hypothetical protein
MANIASSLFGLVGLLGPVGLLGRANLGASSLLLALASASCQKQSAAPPANYAPPQAGPMGSPVTQAPGYGDGTTPLLAASPAPAAASGVPNAALSTPNAFAPPCTGDGQCLTHRCNVAAQKCALPCQTDNDCIPGNVCIAPTCLPKLQ